jgi:hypothetical protein
VDHVGGVTLSLSSLQDDLADAHVAARYAERERALGQRRLEARVRFGQRLAGLEPFGEAQRVVQVARLAEAPRALGTRHAALRPRPCHERHVGVLVVGGAREQLAVGDGLRIGQRAACVGERAL